MAARGNEVAVRGGQHGSSLEIRRDQSAFTPEQVDALKRMNGWRDVPDTELQMFFYQAKRTGLDPLAKQIYLINRGGRFTVQTSIDGMRLIADRTGRYAGSDSPAFGEDSAGLFCEMTVYKLVGNPPVRVPFTAKVYMDEYRSNTPTWKNMPRQMLAKTAEGAALRKGFPADLSGLHTQEDSADGETSVDDGGVQDVPQVEPVYHAEVVEDAAGDEAENHRDAITMIEDLLDSAPDGYFGDEKKIRDYAGRGMDYALVTLKRLKRKIEEGQGVVEDDEKLPESNPPEADPPDREPDEIDVTDEDMAAMGFGEDS